MKKLCALLLCLLLAMPMIASAESSAPLFDEPRTFSMFINNYWHTTLLDENLNDTVSVALREATNVSLAIDMVRVDGDDTELNLLIANGELPDMIFTSGNSRTQLIEDGYILALDELVEENCPNIIQNFGHVLNDWRDPDGKLYGIGTFVWNDPKYALNLSVNTVYMRYDILKELGYEKLERANEYDSFITMDEYVGLLDRVREAYPEMTPMLFDAGNAVSVLAMSKGIPCTQIPGSAVASYEDGKAVSLYSSKYIPEYIETLHGFYANGYTPEDVAVLTKEQVQALISTGEVFSTFGNLEGLEESQAPLGELGDDHRMVMFYLREDPSVTDLYINNYAVAEPANLLITKDCEDPVALLKYLDFCASFEGSTIIGAGKEGVTYSVGEDGWLIPTEETVAGYAAWDTNMIKKHGLGSWLNILPCLEGLGPNGQAFDINAEACFTADRWVVYNNTDYKHFAYPRILSTLGQLSTEDDWEAFDALSRIETYFGDRIAKAVVSPDLETAMKEWETCQAQMKADGLEKLDEAVAAAWTRLAEHYQCDPAELIRTEAQK